MASCGSSTSLLRLDSRLRPWARALVAAVQGVDPRAQVTSTFRTAQQQACLRAAAASGDTTAMRPAVHSLHELGIAFDVAASPAALTYGHQLWLAWGGAAPVSGDPVHFQPMVSPAGLVPEAG